MIDKTAVIHPSAQIADDAIIGPYVVIGENVKIGMNAIVECHTEIGDGTILAPNAHIGGAPQDYSFKNEDTKLIIGKNCVIREFAPIHRATTKEDWKTEIGDNCLIMALSHIGHDCKFGNNVIFWKIPPLKDSSNLIITFDGLLFGYNSSNPLSETMIILLARFLILLTLSTVE